MKLTKIERQKNQPDRYSLFVNEQFLMGIHEELLIEFALYKDQLIDQALINQLYEAEYRQNIYQSAIHYLSFRLRSIQEMRDYLTQKLQKETQSASKQPRQNQQEMLNDGSEIEPIIESTLEILLDQGYLNDLIFSESYTRTQALLNYKGPLTIRRELLRKGVDDQTIVAALEEYSFEQQLENIAEVARKFKRRRNRRFAPKMMRNRLIEHLRVKGFTQETIDWYLQTANFEESENNEASLLQATADKLLRTRRRRYQGRELRQRVKQGLFQRGFDYHLINEWEQAHQAEFEEEHDFYE